MRGRLIFPFVVEIARLDTSSTEADPADADPDRPVDSGFDPIFREPRVLPDSANDTTGTTARQELPVVQIPAQIEAETFDRLQMLASGDSPEGLFRIILHFKDLERLSLVRANGVAAFNPGDRLHRILHKRDLSLVQEIPDPPGLYARHLLPRGWGLSVINPKRNLLFIDFEARTQSSR